MKAQHTLTEAAQEYLDRRARKVHPAGSFDNAGRWYPHDDERQECCSAVRSPSRSYPYSYMVHCRTIGHVAHLYGVDEASLRQQVRDLSPRQPAQRRAGTHYKAVAVVNGRYLSIYDGQTEYALGQELRQTAHQGHGGGYYVYPTAQEAALADVPDDSAYRHAEWIVLAVECAGSYCRYSNGKLAFSRLTPVAVAMTAQQVADLRAWA